MGFPGTWMTESESMVYRVVPKCACSTIGQIMFYSDHGRFFDGDIHDATSGLHKWAHGSEPAADRAQREGAPVFRLHLRAQPLHADPVLASSTRSAGSSATANAIAATWCRCWCRNTGSRSAARTGRTSSTRSPASAGFCCSRATPSAGKKPMEPDIHWSAMAGHVSTFIVNGGRYDRIFFTEEFDQGMQGVLEGQSARHTRSTCATIPRFNESEGHGPKARASGRGLFRRSVDAPDVGDLQARLPAVPL